MISTADLAQFKQMYKKEYGITLTDAEALKLATNLLNLYKAVYLGNQKQTTNN